MTIIKTYSVAADITSSTIDITKLHREILDSSCVVNLFGLEVDDDVINVYGDSISSVVTMDAILDSHTSANTKPKHYILGIVPPSIVEKDIIAINYKTELKSGIRLEPTHHFTDDGLLDKTEYHHEYIDAQSVSQHKLVIEVSESYTTKATDIGLNPSERAIEKRTKTWKWAYEDGVLDSVNCKTKEKPYKNSVNQRRIGTRRRENILSALGDNVGYALVLQGIATDEANANILLKQLARTFQTSMDTYKVYGDENVYQEILNDVTIPWLNDTVFSTPFVAAHPLKAYEGLYDTMLVDMQGKTLRTYAIEKLKGLVK